jgi:hypothetical protein
VRSAAALLFAGALVASGIAGCRATLPSVPLPPDDPLPNVLLSSLESRGQSIRSARGLLRLAVDAPNLHFRRPQRFAALRPASLRVETLGLFSQIAAILVTRGDRYQFFDATEAGLRQGPITPDLLWRVARIDLAPREAVELLLGTLRVDEDLVPVAARRLADDAVAFSLRERAGAVVSELEFDSLGRLRGFRQLAQRSGGRAQWHARFSEYRDVGGTAFAHRVELGFPRTEGRATIRFDEVELNPELPAELFVLRLEPAPAPPVSATPAG